MILWCLTIIFVLLLIIWFMKVQDYLEKLFSCQWKGIFPRPAPWILYSCCMAQPSDEYFPVIPVGVTAPVQTIGTRSWFCYSSHKHLAAVAAANPCARQRPNNLIYQVLFSFFFLSLGSIRAHHSFELLDNKSVLHYFWYWIIQLFRQLCETMLLLTSVAKLSFFSLLI